jgi:hypothetical protein
VHSGSVDTQDLRGLSNGRQFAGGVFNRRLKPGNVSIAAQASDLIGSESFSSRRLAILTIQDAGDNIVGIEKGEAAKKRDRVFGADTSRLKTRQREIHFCERAAVPAQSQMSTLCWTIDSDNHFFQQGAQEFLAITIRGGGCGPDSAQIGAKSEEFVLTFMGEWRRLLLHAPHELCFGRGKIAQTFFPLCLKPTSYESVFRLDRAILALCAFRFVASAFQRKTPLAQSCILIGFELLHGELRGFDRRRCHRF